MELRDYKLYPVLGNIFTELGLIRLITSYIPLDELLIIGVDEYVGKWFLNHHVIKPNRVLTTHEEDIVITRIILTRGNAKIDAPYITQFSSRLRYIIMKYATTFNHGLLKFIVREEFINHDPALIRDLITSQNTSHLLTEEYTTVILHISLRYDDVETVKVLLKNSDTDQQTKFTLETVHEGKEEMALMMYTTFNITPQILRECIFNLFRLCMRKLISRLLRDYTPPTMNPYMEGLSDPLTCVLKYWPDLVPRLVQLKLFNTSQDVLYRTQVNVNTYADYVSQIRYTHKDFISILSYYHDSGLSKYSNVLETATITFCD